MKARIPDYTLIICEKPDAARKVAEALADGSVMSMLADGVEVLNFERAGARYVVCAALGHLYALSDSFSQRETFPVFDLEWYPGNMVEDRTKGIRRRISSIERLARDAKSFINACDYDTEGETIGDNILRYACGGKQDTASRAKFSTLTKEDLVSAFQDAAPGTGRGLARAGRARHVLDFVWGINLSRALSTAVNAKGTGYRTISMGRVQGPALAFVVDREIEVQSFVPNPYWTVSALFEKDDTRFRASSSRGKFQRKSEADVVMSECEGKSGVVSKVARTVFREPPPPPFNTGALQREVYRLLGYSPAKTLQIAEHLYLDALISYPRTSSQKLPASIGYREILSKLSRLSEYTRSCEEVLRRRLSPKEGEQEDRAHPAIYPTGELPKRPLSGVDAKVFDIIVRRFLSCFGEDAVRERVNSTIDVAGHEFETIGRTTIRSGWMDYYGKHANAEDRASPRLVDGEVLRVIEMDCEEKLEAAPQRYNQSSLLEQMEREGLGTKATRAETIATLVKRGYVAGDPMTATELGISLVDTMQKYCPKIVSMQLTREIEGELEDVEGGRTDDADVVARAIGVISKQVELLRLNETGVGEEVGASLWSKDRSNVLGVCPLCKTGNLIVIRSRKSGKRFVGCANYSYGCKASAPLPQRGTIKSARRPCSKCGWPIVYVRRGRFPWKLCVNMDCESKAGMRNTLQVVQKTK
jgi:DNA topoisomerase-1